MSKFEYYPEISNKQEIKSYNLPKFAFCKTIMRKTKDDIKIEFHQSILFFLDHGRYG